MYDAFSYLVTTEQERKINVHGSSPLQDLPNVNSFFGIDLETGSLIVAAIGIIHPMTYGCTLFMPMSYLLISIWLFVSLYFAASVILFIGLVKEDALLVSIWVWYAVIFVPLMLMMMVLLVLVFTSRRQRNRVFAAIIGILWYILTIYFILVVNSHWKRLLRRFPVYPKESENISPASK